MPARLCNVSFTDSSGVTHSVDVTAETLFEAIAFALRDLRSAGLTAVLPGPATRVVVRVKSAADAEHSVTFRQFESWLHGVARSPRDKVARQRVREALGGDAA